MKYSRVPKLASCILLYLSFGLSQRNNIQYPRFQESRAEYAAPLANNRNVDEDDYYYDEEDEEEIDDDNRNDYQPPPRVVRPGNGPSRQRFMETNRSQTNSKQFLKSGSMNTQGSQALQAMDISNQVQYGEQAFLSMTNQATQAVGVDAEQKQMQAALAEIKDEIVRDSQEINRENDWIKQVDELIKTYSVKRGNVSKNIVSLRETVKDLLVKKRQVQNIILQKELKTKLDDATKDMNTLDSALNHVQDTESSFRTTKVSLEQTMNKLNDALAELQGKPKESSQQKSQNAGQGSQQQPSEGGQTQQKGQQNTSSEQQKQASE